MRLNEFSNKKLSQYKTAAAADATKADAAGDFARGHKRFKGINAATKKQFDNDAKLAKLKEQGVAEGVDSENNPWHVTDVDAVSETDFEVALQGPAGIKLNFVIRPVDFVETQRERYQIDSMDVRDLQSGKTMHWGSMQNLGKWEPIFDAIDEHFWMDRSLQAHLAKIVDYYMDAGEHGKNPDMMSDLDKRDPNGIAVSAKDFVASHNQADAAIKSAKKGVAEAPKSAAVRLGRAIQRVQGKTAASQARSIIPSSIPKPEPKPQEKQVTKELKTGPAAHFTPKDAHVKRGQFVGGESKKKGADGKACWDGYRYNGTKKGKDSCVKVSEDVENIMATLIDKIIVNEAIQNNNR